MVKSPSKEDIWYLVPDIEIRVHESWINLVQYCQANLEFGTLIVKIANALPTRRLKEVPSIRVDKPSKLTKDDISYWIPSVDVRVHYSWINLIQWCQNYYVSGDLGFMLVSAHPTEIVKTDQRVDFSKPETIPSGIPLNFDKIRY